MSRLAEALRPIPPEGTTHTYLQLRTSSTHRGHPKPQTAMGMFCTDEPHCGWDVTCDVMDRICWRRSGACAARGRRAWRCRTARRWRGACIWRRSTRASRTTRCRSCTCRSRNSPPASRASSPPTTARRCEKAPLPYALMSVPYVDVAGGHSSRLHLREHLLSLLPLLALAVTRRGGFCTFCRWASPARTSVPE